MGILDHIRSLLGGKQQSPEAKRNLGSLGAASDALDELRGDRISTQPPDHGASATENVAAAVKDYGLSRFSGETDAMGGASKSYRPAKTRRQRKLEG